jgi:hypothetical protein
LHVHFTPTFSSWINQVERFFALLSEQQIKRSVHRSTAELEAAIHTYIQNPQYQSKTVPIDQVCRRHPRIDRAILSSNSQRA